ncbi:hypothetical protein M758_6G213000 [Ceratodon purpureus]|nr:hypothetical protein M758_6G213000 [Ceratodon purpureus]
MERQQGVQPAGSTTDVTNIHGRMDEICAWAALPRWAVDELRPLARQLARALSPKEAPLLGSTGGAQPGRRVLVCHVREPRGSASGGECNAGSGNWRAAGVTARIDIHVQGRKEGRKEVRKEGMDRLGQSRGAGEDDPSTSAALIRSALHCTAHLT